MTPDLRTIARALGGEVSGRQVLAPGPGHSPGDRSLAVRLSHQSPTGFIVHSHSGDDFKVSRDYVAERLGLGSDAWRARRPSLYNVQDRRRDRTVDVVHGSDARVFVNDDNIHIDNSDRIARARAIWDQAGEIRGSVGETYLAGRGLDPNLVDIVHEVLRFHPRCPWRDDASGEVIRVPAMVAAMRSITDDTITAVHKTRLTPEGAKVARKMQGVALGSAIKLDDDAEVTMGLAIGEGIETCIAAKLIGFRPAWALGSAGAIAAFPVLAGIECLTLLAENDPTNARAVETCARRWHEAGREVTVIEPRHGSDILDAMRGAA